MQFPAWTRASSTRARFFLIWFRKTWTQKIARSYSDTRELETGLREEARRLHYKNTHRRQPACCPLPLPGRSAASAPRSGPRSAGIWRLSLGKGAASQERGLRQGQWCPQHRALAAAPWCSPGDGRTRLQGTTLRPAAAHAPGRQRSTSQAANAGAGSDEGRTGLLPDPRRSHVSLHQPSRDGGSTTPPSSPNGVRGSGGVAAGCILPIHGTPCTPLPGPGDHCLLTAAQTGLAPSQLQLQKEPSPYFCFWFK